jgi:hypothetical protein
MKCYQTIILGDQQLEVRFDYTPEDPGVYTLPNGDPGYPPSPESIDEIISIKWGDIDVTDLVYEFFELDQMEFEEMLIDEMKENY